MRVCVRACVSQNEEPLVSVGAADLLHVPQDGQGLPPALRAAEGLDEEAGGPRLQCREGPPHDVVAVQGLCVVPPLHTQGQVLQQQLVGHRPCVHGNKGQQGPLG